MNHRWTILGRYIGGANVITAQYVRKVVPGRVSLAAEYQAQLGTGSQVRRNVLPSKGNSTESKN